MQGMEPGTAVESDSKEMRGMIRESDAVALTKGKGNYGCAAVIMQHTGRTDGATLHVI